MAKFDRDQLKGLIKECLLEILIEGVGRPQRSASSTAHRVAPAAFAKGQRQGKVVNEGFDRAIKSTVNAVTNDPVLQDILGDTARTTLQQQMAGEPRVPGAVGSSGLPDAPVEAFGGSNKWASLAFGAPKSKDQTKK